MPTFVPFPLLVSALLLFSLPAVSPPSYFFHPPYMISLEDQARIPSSMSLFTIPLYRRFTEAFKDGWLKGRREPKMRLPVWPSSDHLARRMLTFTSMQS